MAATPERRPKTKEKHHLKSSKRKQLEEQEEERQTLTLDDVRRLGNELLLSRAHLNNLPVLLSFLSPSPSHSLDFALESLISVQSFFVPLLSEMRSGGEGGDETNDPESVFRVWLRSRFDEFVISLIDLAVSSETDDALREVALDAIMDFVKLGKDGRFQSAIYHKFLHRIVYSADSFHPLLVSLESKYFKYTDVRYFTCTSLDKFATNFGKTNNIESRKLGLDNDEGQSKSRDEIAIHNMYAILSSFPPLELNKEPSYDMWSEFGLSSKEEKATAKLPSARQITKKLKSKFTKVWLSFLKLPLPIDVYKEVLATLHQSVIPYMANPAILCDFLTRSYDIGGVISVMALSGLFILMTQHGLEYPNFYPKLYALLTPSVFFAKHRAVFFQLLDTCLKSSYLPAYLAAAFAKKLSRLTLSVPPSGALLIIALTHNLLRRHPSINFLVHSNVDEEGNNNQASENAKDSSESTNEIHRKKRGKDPFNIDETDPAKSNSMGSSLWEIETLCHHYSPAVSRFVASLENDLTNRAKTTEISVADFSSGSYATIFRDEIRRRIKQVPLAFYRVTPSSLFSDLDFPGWSFGDKIGDMNETMIINPNGGPNTVGIDDTANAKRQRLET